MRRIRITSVPELNAKKWKHAYGGDLNNNFLNNNNNNMKHKFADGGGYIDPPYIENQYSIPENIHYGDISNYITNTHEFDSRNWEEKEGEKWVKSPEKTILESGYIPEVQVRAPYKDNKDRYIGQVADYLALLKSAGVNNNYERLLHIVKLAYQDPENLNEDGSFNLRGFAQMALMQHFGPGSYYLMGESLLHGNLDNYDYMDRLKRYYPGSEDTYYERLIQRPEEWDKTFPEYFLDDRYVRKHDNGGTLDNNDMNRNYFATGGYPTDPPEPEYYAGRIPEVTIRPENFFYRNIPYELNVSTTVRLPLVPETPIKYYTSYESTNKVKRLNENEEALKHLMDYLIHREGDYLFNPATYNNDLNGRMRQYFKNKKACGGRMYAEGGEVDPAMMQGGEVPPEAGGMPPEMMGAPAPQEGGMPMPLEGAPMPEQGGMPVEAGMPPQEEYPEEEMPEEEGGQDEWEEGFWEARDEAMAEGKKTFEYDGKVYPTDLGARNIKKKPKKKKYGGSLKVPKEILPY